MKELVIKRTFQIKQFEPVTFEATFERRPVSVVSGAPIESTNGMIDRAFNEFDIILRRAGLNDQIQWVNPIGQRDPVTKEDRDDMMDLADRIDKVLEENDL
jgi:hypothetical protein